MNPSASISSGQEAENEEKGEENANVWGFFISEVGLFRFRLLVDLEDKL